MEYDFNVSKIDCPKEGQTHLENRQKEIGTFWLSLLAY